MDEWQWDKTLFEGTAEFYSAGRLPYALGIAEVLRETLQLDGSGRLLDLGCGPGTVSLLLADHFANIIGLDPDPGMIAEGQREATAAGVSHMTWAKAKAEDLPDYIDDVDVVTMGASFHWFDRAHVARSLLKILTARGVVVQIDAPAYRADDAQPVSRLPFPVVPFEAIAKVRIVHLGPDRRAGQGIRNSSPDGEDGVFTANGFMPAVQVIVPDRRVLTRSVEQVVANVYSNSGTAPHLFGSSISKFDEDLRACLATASPSGNFSVFLPDNVLNIWRPRRP